MNDKIYFNCNFKTIRISFVFIFYVKLKGDIPAFNPQNSTLYPINNVHISVISSVDLHSLKHLMPRLELMCWSYSKFVEFRELDEGILFD